ncbi:MAG: hypothetical protein KAH64_03850 [Nitrosomonadaceae bacterium]|nr:hypothetical protein [Nitrosomonadaceae bacterium]
MQKLLCILVVLSALLMSGCYETKQEYVLNPDGSGKVTLQASFMHISLNDESDPEQELKDAVKNILEKSECVDAWSDVSYKLLDDGRTYFKGTAYFRKLANLKFHNLGNTEINWRKSTKDSMVLTFNPEEKSEKNESDKAAPKKLSDEEIKQEIIKERAKYKQQVRPMLTMFLGNMKEEILFKLPGTIRTKNNLKNTKDGRIRFLIEGKKMLEAIDKIIYDDELLTQELKKGREISKDKPEFGNEFNKMIFGSSGPVEAVVEGEFKPLFNYKNQMTKARSDYPEMLKKLEIGQSIPLAIASDSDKFKSVQIVGIRWVRFSDQKRGIRPFNYDAGYSLSIIAELPGPAISVSEGKLTKAIADNGTDLLPKKEWDRKIGFPNLSKDKSTVIFDINLILPPDDVKSIKEISGTLKYLTAGSVKEVDLGISDFKAGSEGTKYSATITSVGKSKWGEGEQLKLELNLKKDSIKDIKLYDEHGTPIKFTGTNISWGGNISTYSYTLKTKFPAKGKIVVEVYEGQQRHELPFKLENISLLGQPLK